MNKLEASIKKMEAIASTVKCPIEKDRMHEEIMQMKNKVTQLDKKHSTAYKELLDSAEHSIICDLNNNNEMLQFDLNCKQSSIKILERVSKTIHPSQHNRFINCVRSIKESISKIETEKSRRKWWTKYI